MVFLLAFRRHDRIRPGDMGRKNRSSMPCICEFPAVRVYIYFFDHEPPHLHIRGWDFHAVLSIPGGRLLAGHLPERLESVWGGWVRQEKEALMENWRRARAGEPLLRVTPPE